MPDSALIVPHTTAGTAPRRFPRAPGGIMGVLAVAYALLPLSSAISALMILGSAIALMAWRRGHPPRSSVPVHPGLYAALIGAVGLSVATSVSPGLSWPSIVLCAGYLAVVWAIARVLDTPERFWSFARLLTGGAILWAAMGILIWAFDWHWSYNSGGLQILIGTPDRRAASIFYHPNILSGYLLLSMGLGMALIFQARGLARWGWIAGFGLMLACQMLTQSRSGWIGTAIALISAGALADRRFLAKVIGAGVVGALLLRDMIVSRLGSLFDMGFGSNANRMRVWHSAQQMILERPLTGFGPGTWPLVYPSFRDPAEFERLPHAHSFFLHLGAEYGLVMLAILLSFVVAIAGHAVLSTWTSPWRRTSLPMACALVGYLVVGVFEFIFSEGRNSILFFTLLGMLAAARCLKDQPLMHGDGAHEDPQEARPHQDQEQHSHAHGQ